MAKQKFVQKFKKKTVKESLEPDLDQIDSMSDLLRVLNWYNSNIQPSRKTKKWVIEYVKENNLKFPWLRYVNEKYFVHPLSTLCRLSARGFELRDSDINRIFEMIGDLKKYHFKRSSESLKERKPNIQDRMLEQSRTLKAEIDFYVDSFLLNQTKTKITNQLNEFNFGSPQTKFLISQIDNYIEEFTQVKSSSKGAKFEKEYFDGYGYSIRTINSLLKYLQELKVECENWICAKKKTKSVRTKSYKTPEEICKKVKCSEKSVITPTKILSSSVAVIYNEKYHKLTLLTAADNDGFMIKGTSIHNYNEKKSKVFSVKKKYRESFFELFKEKMTITKIKNTLDGEAFKKTKNKPNGRLSEHSNILKVIK